VTRTVHKGREPAELPDVLQTLRSRKEEARTRYGVEFVGVVGSLARGQARSDSDVDVLMEIVGETTYFRLGELAADLEDAFGRTVDLVDRNLLKPRLRVEMERDLVRA